MVGRCALLAGVAAQFLAMAHAVLNPLQTHNIAQPRMNRTIGGTTSIGPQNFMKLTYLHHR